MNTAAVARPELIAEIADRFGNQVLVLSLDARRCQDGAATDSGFEITTHGGRRGTGQDAVEWCVRAAELGAGEILLNSMDADGTRAGFDTELIRPVRREVTVPLIASGGAGAAEHFPPAVEAGADAVLAASVFHFGAAADRRRQGRAGRGRHPGPLSGVRSAAGRRAIAPSQDDRHPGDVAAAGGPEQQLHRLALDRAAAGAEPLLRAGDVGAAQHDAPRRPAARRANSSRRSRARPVAAAAARAAPSPAGRGGRPRGGSRTRWC